MKERDERRKRLKVMKEIDERRKRLIGTSFGLALVEFSGEGCEQLYVRTGKTEKRPIEVEFWEGYSIPNRAILTTRQAIEMSRLIINHYIKGGRLWRYLIMSAISWFTRAR